MLKKLITYPSINFGVQYVIGVTYSSMAHTVWAILYGNSPYFLRLSSQIPGPNYSFHNRKVFFGFFFTTEKTQTVLISVLLGRCPGPSLLF